MDDILMIRCGLAFMLATWTFYLLLLLFMDGVEDRSGRFWSFLKRLLHL